MAKWSSSTKHLPSEINNGNQYQVKDRLVMEQLNAITENSFYAIEKVDTVISDAENIVEQGKSEIQNTTSQGKSELNSIVDNAESLVDKANTSINTVVGTANEALFKVEQVLKNEGYWGSNPNLLINGDFRVNQRGIYTNNSTSGYMADRWFKLMGDAFSVEFIDNSCMAMVVNEGTGYASIIKQTIEADNLLGMTLTASLNITELYVQNATGIYVTISFRNSNNEQISYVNFPNLTIGLNALTFEVPSDAIYISFSINANRNIAINGDTITFDSPKLEIGLVATAFSPRPYAEELAMCQRYFINPHIQSLAFATYSASVAYPELALPVTMRTKPTVTVKTYPLKRGQGASVAITTLSVASIHKSGVMFHLIDSFVENQVYVLTDGEVELDAEIY